MSRFSLMLRFCADLTRLLQVTSSVLHTGLEKHFIKANFTLNMSVCCYVYSWSPQVRFPSEQTYTNTSLNLHCGGYLKFVWSLVWPESNWEENKTRNVWKWWPPALARSNNDWIWHCEEDRGLSRWSYDRRTIWWLWVKSPKMWGF